MTGGSRREESVTFSLRELTRLEDERIEREQRDRASRAAAEEARRERERHDARERERAREKEEQRAREETEARREAMSRAAVEQARIDVEARARADEAARERQHEVELARIRAGASHAYGARVVVASGIIGAVLALGVCLATYYGAVKPAVDHTIATLSSSLARADAKSNEFFQTTLEQRKRIAELELRLAQSPREMDSGRASGTSAPAKSTHPTSAWVGPPKKEEPPPTAGFSDACAKSKDPLCGLDLHHPR